MSRLQAAAVDFSQINTFHSQFKTLTEWSIIRICCSLICLPKGPLWIQSLLSIYHVTSYYVRPHLTNSKTLWFYGALVKMEPGRVNALRGRLKTAWNSVGLHTPFTLTICRQLHTRSWGSLLWNLDGRAAWCWPENKHFIWLDNFHKSQYWWHPPTPPPLKSPTAPPAALFISTRLKSFLSCLAFALISEVVTGSTVWLKLFVVQLLHVIIEILLVPPDLGSSGRRFESVILTLTFLSVSGSIPIIQLPLIGAMPVMPGSRGPAKCRNSCKICKWVWCTRCKCSHTHTDTHKQMYNS